MNRPVSRILRRRYGPGASQWVDHYLPEPSPDGPARGIAIVIHGGFWKAEYGAEYGAPVAADLSRRGWHAWNVEYRRVGRRDEEGAGGGVPQTLDDVAAAIDLLIEVPGLPPGGPVVAVGHSAGGHLACWAAARSRAGWPERFPLTGVVSAAGVLDLVAAERDGLGGGAVARLLGEWEQPERVDPTRLLPLTVPVHCVHPRGDEDVPLSQSVEYVERARQAGADAELTLVDGDHYAVNDPGSAAWPAVLAALERVAAAGR